jgi:hypothetical protein
MRASLLIAASLGIVALPVHAQLAGKYSFEALNENASIPGEVEITGTAPALAGWIRWVSNQGPDSARINQVAQAGANVTVIGENQTGRWTLRLAFVADTFSGTYEGPASGTLHGRRANTPDISGIYDFEARSTEGKQVNGRLVVRQAGGQYTGSVAPDGNEPAPFSRFTTQGAGVVIEAGVGNGAVVTLRLQARADSLVGTYQLSGGMMETGNFRAGKVRP